MTIYFLTFAVFMRFVYFFFVGETINHHYRHKDQEKFGLMKWKKFKKIASYILTLEGLSFVFVCILTKGSIILPSAGVRFVAIALIILGISAKVSARRAIGEEGYYWQNFFVPDRHSEKRQVRKGFYRVFDHPMYGVGYAHLFGFALLMQSYEGLVLAGFNWFMIWAFYLLYEKPRDDQEKFKSLSEESVA
jgi:protein-S-isoprenylcysteine O-methyltransferase Ste14